MCCVDSDCYCPIKNDTVSPIDCEKCKNDKESKKNQIRILFKVLTNNNQNNNINIVIK